MDAYQNYEAKRNAAESFKKWSERAILFVLAPIVVASSIAEIADYSFEDIQLGPYPLLTGWIALFAMYVLMGKNKKNAAAVLDAGKAWADEGLKREGRP